MKIVHAIAVILLSAGAILACSSGGSTVPDCLLDGDCAASQQCRDGKCVALTCAKDGDCRGGMRCVSGTCTAVSGCTSAADCNGWQCQTATGKCVQCLGDGDCDGNLKCVATVCRPGCSTNADCLSAAPVCDPVSGTCVQCVKASDCQTGEKCQANQCVPDTTGCQSDADCQAPTPRCLVASHRCVQCLTVADCPNAADYTCTGNTCQPVSTGCQNDNDCTIPEFPHCNAQTGQCLGCLDNGHCTAPQICTEDHVCGYPSCGSETCTEDKPVCDPATTTCVQCLASEDCPPSSSGTNRYCDTTAKKCVDCLDDTHCASGLHCWLAEHVCVQCYRNGHCAANELCDTESHTCSDGFTDCMALGNFRQCPAGSFLYDFGMANEQAAGCVRICTDPTDCNPGYTCKTISTMRISLCLPVYNKYANCEAMRDFGSRCRVAGDCGLGNSADALCYPPNAIERACTIPCNSNEDCPFIDLFRPKCVRDPNSTGYVCGVL